MSSPVNISAFQYSVHRRESQDSASFSPPQATTELSDSTPTKAGETDADRRKYDDFDDYVPVNSTDGDGERETFSRRLMEDLTWAFECR